MSGRRADSYSADLVVDLAGVVFCCVRWGSALLAERPAPHRAANRVPVSGSHPANRPVPDCVNVTSVVLYRSVAAAVHAIRVIYLPTRLTHRRTPGWSARRRGLDQPPTRVIVLGRESVNLDECVFCRRRANAARPSHHLFTPGEGTCMDAARTGDRCWCPTWPRRPRGPGGPYTPRPWSNRPGSAGFAWPLQWAMINRSNPTPSLSSTRCMRLLPP